MSNRSLFIVALVALGFCLYLYFEGGAPGTLAREAEAARLVILNQDAIERIELTNPSGTYVFLKGADRKWEMEKPIRFPVDPEAIGTLLSELEAAAKQRVIQAEELGDYQASLQQFGLKDPRITARFQSPQEVVELQVGGKTAAGGMYYARVRDSKKQEITVVDDVVESLLMQNLDLWRNPQIFDFDAETALSLHLRKGGQEVEVLQEEGLWAITRPFKETAVLDQVNAYLGLVSSLRVANFVAESGADLAQYGLNTPEFTLEVKMADQSSQILRVGKAKPDQPGQVYAQFGDRPAIFTLPVKQADQIGQLLNVVRPRSLFALSADTVVRRIEITQSGSSLTLELNVGVPDAWVVRGDGVERAANALGAADMIQAMEIQRAANFYSSVDNPPAEYGLQKPTAIVSVSGYSPSAPDKSFERKVIFGAIKENMVYVQTSALPFVVDVDRRFLAAFPKGVAGWFDLHLGFPAAEKISRMSWKQEGYDLTVEKGADGKWVSVPPGKAIDEKFLQVQLPFLAGLKAQHWTGKAVKKDFAKPRFVLEVWEGDRSRQLLLGPKQNDGSSLAKMADDEYAFILTAEDVQKVMVRPLPGEPLSIAP